jgi:hypothetical protein
VRSRRQPPLLDLCVDLAVLAVPDCPDLGDLDAEVTCVVLHNPPDDAPVTIADGGLAVADEAA